MTRHVWKNGVIIPNGITDRQRDVLLAIIEYLAANGYPPTMREIGDAVGIGSTNGVSEHLQALTKKGYLEPRVPLVSRGLKLTAKAASYRTLARRGA